MDKIQPTLEVVEMESHFKIKSFQISHNRDTKTLKLYSNHHPYQINDN